MRRPFTRLAIVNRGEPAMRVIHAVRELNAQREQPIRLIALHVPAKRHAMFVRQADEAVELPSGYLDLAGVEHALKIARADAVWAGWGLVAERPEFVELCERLGLVFVGPDSRVMRLAGDKIAAKRLAEESGVPVAPWSGPLTSVQEARGNAERIGFPLMIKAAAGGGGRGIRRVDDASAFEPAFVAARAAAREAFGDGTLLLERVIAPARHVEVQIIADGEGGAWAVGVRDCSGQRRRHKVIEESSSPALDAEQERELLEASRRFALRVGYSNAGTLEFLYDPATRRFSFLELNARLQSEHPVTEAVTGLDLVKLGLHVAAGGRLEGDAPAPDGHAISARLNAEDPSLGFVPTPGRVSLLRVPTGPGLRVDTGVSEGDTIPAELDPTIAKLIAWGRDRDEALARLRRALVETVVVMDGGTTNQGFLLEVLERPELRRGEIDTTWLDRLEIEGEIVPARHADVALVQAAIALSEAEVAADQARFYAYARRGRPHAQPGAVRTVDVRHRGQSYRCAVSQIGSTVHRVTVDDSTVEVDQEHLSPHERRLVLWGRTHRTVVSLHGEDLLVEVDGLPHHLSRDDGGLVRNLAPAVIVSIPVTVGDVVDAGEVVAVVESMKMETSLTAPFRGRVREVLAGANVQVAAQAPLVRLERLDDEPVERGAERIAFTAAAPSPREGRDRCREDLRRLEQVILGYDLDAAEARRTVADLHGASAATLDADPALLAAEDRLLSAFADLRALSLPSHASDAPEGELERSPQEHLNAFLRSLDASAEGVPPRYAALLRRALRHYGVASLDRSPALEQACYRIFLAQRRAGVAQTIVLAILDRRLQNAAAVARMRGDDLHDALDRLVDATQGRDELICDLAREVRFQLYDAPVINAAREAIYEEAEANLAALVADPDGPRRDELIAALVDCPQPLAPQITRAIGTATPPVRQALLEILTRRFYRVRSLEGFAPGMLDGHPFVLARYRHEGPARRLATAVVDLRELAGATRAFAAWAAQAGSDEVAVADFYAEPTDPLPAADELAEQLRTTLGGVALPESVRRIVVTVTQSGAARGMSAMTPFTFRLGPDGPTEDRVLRGMHPMMSHRLRLSRLSQFGLERLPAGEDLYLFHGVAYSNPKDERLFALAEVRDLTPLRDSAGNVITLPELERMLVAAFEGIRSFQSRRPPSRRLQWNRIMFHVWPTIELGADELRRVLRRLVPPSAGLGIEMAMMSGRLREPDGSVRERVLRLFAPAGEVVIEIDDTPTEPLQPLDESAQRVISARRRGMLHPAELVKLLAPPRGRLAAAGQPPGEFVEHDLDDAGRLVPVDRPPATNPAGIVVGLVRNFTDRHPEGMLRVLLAGDPTRALGALTLEEGARIIAALDLAEELGVPVDWFALSAGARIAMDSGTETMDGIARVLRRVIEFAQGGGEINVVVTGINVGAQPYCNAEATMLMHTRGILVMTPASAMVLTGKLSLDYSGGVSAEDNYGIGGYERIMGPNGEAQYWAPDLAGACRLLLDYYEHSYVAPGERFPRPARSTDPVDRDVRSAPHRLPGSDLKHVGDIFSEDTNPGRKKAFDMRSVMHAVVDADHPPLERWAPMRDAEMAIVWDAHLGGNPVTLVGIEARPLERHGQIPADGPERWTAGTLFPRASKKIARAINAVAGRRPLVVLANLAGFDGSPESMRDWQLEFGAEIGRAVVNFDGPIVFCVVSRYHGGAFVVFSRKLNEQMEVLALEGTHASVIGGGPASMVVFTREVRQAAERDERIVALDARIAGADGSERQRLRAERAELWETVLSDQRARVAAEFDAIHSVERAVRMGSVDRIIDPAQLRPHLIDAVQRGITRAQGAPAVEGSRLAGARAS